MSHQNSTISVNTIEPQSGTTLTIGQSGQNVVVNADSIKNNVLKDAGGNALWTSNGSGVLSGVNAGFGSAQVLISTQNITDQTSVAFTSGLDSTYKEYVFEFLGINPTVQQSYFTFQGSTDGGSSYGLTITSTAFGARHNETDGDHGLQYEPNWDLAQSTNYQYILNYLGADADECAVGELHIFNPASTTYVKNWYARCTWTNGDTVPAAFDLGVAGYFNTTSAINAINFKMNTGNFDGTVKMYGIK